MATPEPRDVTALLDATTDAERSAHRATFVRDVRARVRELARREYAATDDRPTVDNVLLFVPNETISAIIHSAILGSPVANPPAM